MRRSWLVVASTLLLLPAVVPVAQADLPFGSTQVVGHLPSVDPSSDPTARGITGASAVWTGDASFIIGGSYISQTHQAADGSLSACRFDGADWILRHDPVTGTIERLGERLPFDLSLSSSVWSGSRLYLFGGISGGWIEGGGIPDSERYDFQPTDAILEFDPATGIARTLDVRLPTPRFGTAAVWMDGKAYVLGGKDGPPILGSTSSEGYYDEVVEFDPSGPSVRVLPVSIGGPKAGMSAVVHGGLLYALAGVERTTHNRTAYTSEIVVVDPVALTSRLLPAEAWDVGPRVAAGLVWTGDRAYLVGGWGPDPRREGFLDSIGEFDPTAGSGRLLDGRLAFSRVASAAVWQGEHGFLYGGKSGFCVVSDEIVRLNVGTTEFHLERSGPPQLDLVPGQRVVLAARIRNEGRTPDTYRLEVHDTYRWGATLVGPSNLPLAPGEEASVDVGLVVPPRSSSNRVTVVVRSVEEPAMSRVATWDLRVPITVELALDGRYSFHEHVTGTFHLRYVDGSAAEGLDVRIAQASRLYQDQPQLYPAISYSTYTDASLRTGLGPVPFDLSDPVHYVPTADAPWHSNGSPRKPTDALFPALPGGHYFFWTVDRTPAEPTYRRPYHVDGVPLPSAPDWDALREEILRRCTGAVPDLGPDACEPFERDPCVGDVVRPLMDPGPALCTGLYDQLEEAQAAAERTVAETLAQVGPLSGQAVQTATDALATVEFVERCLEEYGVDVIPDSLYGDPLRKPPAPIGGLCENVHDGGL